MKTSNVRLSKRTQRGSAFITVFILLMLMSVGAVAYVSTATQNLREAKRQKLDVQTSSLCESAVQSVAFSLWKPFKIAQNFANLDTVCTGASEGSPGAALSGEISNVGKYSAGVIKYDTVDAFTKRVTIRAVGWVDTNSNGAVDDNEPQKLVDVVATYQLERSKVFDYTYFINNYGWMDGFSPTTLVVNGDMRANGDFTITRGSPTINGSVIATHNEKLDPAPTGLVNVAPVKWDNGTYNPVAAANGRMRQGYNSGTMGAKGSDQYEGWRDFAFESSGSVVNGRSDGAVIGDANGQNAWTRTSVGDTPAKTLLDGTPSKEVIMPDLNNLTYYKNLSQAYTDPKSTFDDGTPNPLAGVGAYVQVWNSTSNQYDTVSTNGVVTGSIALIGSAAHPIKIHGPVTVTEDCAIKGYVDGQGTLYAGRNVHIVGSIKYTNPPDFRGTNQTTIDRANQKKNMLALAARGSVIMGDTATFTNSYPLQYMKPPFTKPRKDELGNTIPAYDATQTDYTGLKKYQSTLGDAYIHSISSGVGTIDAVVYANFTGGGNLGLDGDGVNFNGSIISRDEAMVIWSLPMNMNYDQRIRERAITNDPLIDLQLPRSPVMLRSSWQDRGFSYQ